MQAKVEELKNSVHEFIDQADDLFLVLIARDTDMPFVHKVLESVDLEQPSDIILRFAQPSEPTGAAYVDAVMRSLEAQIAEVNELKKKENIEPWPSLPATCHDSRVRDRDRVLTAMRHVRGFFPKDEDHRVVWCFLPAPFGNAAGYAQVMAGLMPRNGFEPWMHSQRIVARDDTDTPFLVPAMQQQGIESALAYRVDFSTPVLLDSMVQQVQAPETPELQRMQTLMQLAAVDQAYQRHPDAIKKWGIANEYFQQQKMPTEQAICFAGFGDSLCATGQPAEGKKRYQQALALSSGVGLNGMPVTMLVAAKTGDVCMALGQPGEAEAYYDMASQIAGKFLNLEFKADCMEKVGIARQVSGNSASAAEVWRNAIGLCKDGDYFLRMKTIAERLVALTKQSGTLAEAREANDHLAYADRMCRERYAS
jgi:hypothetical protein